MTPVQEAFLTLLRSSLGGTSAPPELSKEQWAELLELAQAHKLLPMIFEAGFPQLRQADPALAAAAKRQVRDQVILQTLRTGEFLELYRALLNRDRAAATREPGEYPDEIWWQQNLSALTNG